MTAFLGGSVLPTPTPLPHSSHFLRGGGGGDFFFWVGSVKVCEFCGLQSPREKLSAYQSETAFPKTEQLKIK